MSKQKDDLNKEFLKACNYDDNITTIQNLIDQGADVNSYNKFGTTALHFACQNDNLKIAKMLLENKANIDIQDVYEMSPLHLACEQGNARIVQMLLEDQANVNIQDQHGNSPLHSACERGDSKIIKMLLENEADINLQNEEEASPLHSACESNNINVVKILLANQANINIQDQYGNSPLHLACAEGYTGIVQILLENQANINLLNEDYRTAFDLVIRPRNINPQIAKILLDYEAQVPYDTITQLNHRLNNVNGDLLSTGKASKMLCILSHLSMKGYLDDNSLIDRTSQLIQAMIRMPNNRFSQDQEFKIIGEIVKSVPYFVFKDDNIIRLLTNKFNTKQLNELESYAGKYVPDKRSVKKSAAARIEYLAALKKQRKEDKNTKTSLGR